MAGIVVTKTVFSTFISFSVIIFISLKIGSTGVFVFEIDNSNCFVVGLQYHLEYGYADTQIWQPYLRWDSDITREVKRVLNKFGDNNRLLLGVH